MQYLALINHIARICNNVWNLNGFLLAIQTWHPSTTLRDLSLSEVSFWIQVQGLPLQNMTIKNAIAIGKGLGQLLKEEENRGSATTFRSFIRVLVSIDDSKPLNPSFDFTRNDGSSTWVSLKYERLDVYCSDCGKLATNSPPTLRRQRTNSPPAILYP